MTRPSRSQATIMSREALPILARFAMSNVLVAFDFDGTLAPIAPTPPQAQMRATTRRLLTRLARCYPCVVISGRRLDELIGLVRPVPVWHLVGDHGSELEGRRRGPLEHLRRWMDVLRRRLTPRDGLILEPKRQSITIHFRRVRNRRALLAELQEALEVLPDARALYSPAAVNLLPAGGSTKGLALREMWNVFACDTAIYVGDDDTDEEAFAAAGPDRLLSIRVGLTRPSIARYRLRRQADIDRLLEALVRLRAGRRRALSGFRTSPGRS